jgi:sec-independent protein translocase protein TatB
VFNLSGTELVFIAVLGLIVLGPEKLPGAMRRAGKIYREIRNISSTVQREVNKVMEEPMRQVKSLVDEPADQLKKSAKDANDIFAGKMPHLEQRPAASAASAYTAAAGSAATTSSTSDVPDVATTAVAADGAGPAVNAPSKPGAVPQSEVGGASADQPASGG